MPQTDKRRCEWKHAVMVTIGCAIVLTSTITARGQEKPTETAPGQLSAATPNIAEEQSAGITAVPNRPTFATTAEAVQRGVFEIEYGFEGGDGHQNINGLLKWGIFKSLELRFANNPIQRDASIAGMGDSSAGFKYRMFSQRKKLPTTAILYTATAPTATAGLGAGAMGHSVQLLLSKDFGKHHIDFNEGVQFVGRPGAGGFDRNYFSALSYSHPITEKWAISAEVAGFSWTNTGTPATMTLLASPSYNVSTRLVLDAGAYIAVYGKLPRVTYFFGVTYSVSDLYHPFSARKSTKN